MGRTVLLVDDHAGFRATLGAYLAEAGYVVVGEAADGAGALTEVARLRPDIVLLDVQLPDADGFEVAREVSRQLDPPDVVMISSRDDPTYATLASESDARGFVAKSRLSRAALERVLG